MNQRMLPYYDSTIDNIFITDITKICTCAVPVYIFITQHKTFFISYRYKYDVISVQ